MQRYWNADGENGHLYQTKFDVLNFWNIVSAVKMHILDNIYAFGYRCFEFTSDDANILPTSYIF